MKKLMVAVVSAASAMLAFGALPHGADFEAYSGGDTFTADKNDTGGTSGTTYWYSDAEEIGTISNGTHNATSVPDMFSGASNAKYLHIDTSGKLYRTVEGNDQNENFTPVSMSTGDGIYLDTLVQFTAADQVFGTDALGDGDKIAIEYAETEEGITNFVVRAGVIGGGTTNYLATVPDFDATEWHRLTVRTLTNVDGNGRPGFKIYVDQVALTILTDNAEFAQSSGLSDDTIFPSAVLAGQTNADEISAVAFTGNGSLDDVVFTSTKPEFIQEATIVTVTWTTNEFTAITLNGTVLSAAEVAAGSYTIEPVDGTVTFSATPVSGYVLGDCTVTPDKGGWNGSDAFTNLVAGATCTIDAIIPLYQVGDKNYEDLQAAMTAASAGTQANPATLKLLAECNQGLAFTGGYVILDLNGCDIQGGAQDDYTIGNAGATLFITNSAVQEASVKVPLSLGGVVGTVEGFTTVQAGKFEGGLVTPMADLETTFPKDFQLITGGKFFDDGDEFYLADCVAEGVSTTKSGDYVIVGGEAPVATDFTVTVTPAQNATYAVTGNATNDGDVYTVAAGETITITATPAWNYEYATTPTGWMAGQDGAITIDVDAEGTVAIPAPTALEGWGFYLGRPVNDAYTVDNVDDLNKLREGVAAGVATANVTFKQTADIDMASAGAFAGIGTYAKVPTAGTPFLGTYDGQGFKISNVTRAAGNTVGIFNQVGPSGVIENLVVENMSFDDSLTGEYGCAIVGNAGGGATLRNLTAAGTFGSASKPSTHNMAGIVVRLSPGATAGAATTIDSCTNNATIYGGYTKLGGINAIVQNQTGFKDGKVVFVNCANNGTLVCKLTATDVTGNAGIVGYIAGTNVELTGCYGNGAITNEDGANTDKDGALVGWTYDGTIKDNGGNAAPAGKKMIGTWGNATETGFLYATVADGVATTISGSIAAGGSYLLEGNAAPTIALAKDESIAFDTALGYTLTETGITAASGLEVNKSTSGTVTTYTAAEPALQPIVPDQGGSAEYADADAATAAAAAINADKENLITVDASVTGEAKTTYLSKVEAVANGTTVTIQFTAEAKPVVQAEVDEETAKLPLAEIAAATGTTEATVTATPGCYYTVKSGTEPGSLTAGDTVLATGTTVTLQIPNKGEAGFYKIEVKPTK